MVAKNRSVTANVIGLPKELQQWWKYLQWTPHNEIDFVRLD